MIKYVIKLRVDWYFHLFQMINTSLEQLNTDKINFSYECSVELLVQIVFSDYSYDYF